MSIWAGHPTPPPGTNITSEYGWCTQDQDWHIQFLGSQRSKYLQESLFCNAFEQIQKSIQLTTPTVCSRRSPSTASAKTLDSWPISTNTTSSGSSAIKSTVRRSCTGRRTPLRACMVSWVFTLASISRARRNNSVVTASAGAPISRRVSRLSSSLD